MRKPTPVTTTAMTAESSSRWNEIDVENDPLAIQGSRVLLRPEAPSLVRARWRKAAFERNTDDNTAAVGRGYRDDEKNDGLAVRLPERCGQGQEGQVARVEHDLDGHELGQQVLLDEKRQEPE